MATNQIRQLFNLPKSENIFDDFACSYNSFPGRVYLSQSYLCFYSTMLGKTTKLILSYDQITKVYKSNNKFSKSIKVHKQAQRAKQTAKNDQAKKEPEEKDKEEIYRFYSFKERDFTFKYIRRLWANSSPHAGSEDDEEDLFLKFHADYGWCIAETLDDDAACFAFCDDLGLFEN